MNTPRLALSRGLALAVASALAACASTYEANPNDPVDMAAQLGDRGALHMGMASLCDQAVGGDYRRAVAQSIAHEQGRLGVLSGLVDRAYRGQPTEALSLHMRSEMAENGLTAAVFCDEALRQAQTDLSRRADHILALGDGPLTLASARDRGWLE